MAGNTGSPIANIVEATGLPSEIWPVIPPFQAPGDGIVGYTLTSARDDDMKSPPYYCEWIQLHDRTIYSLHCLPVAHILGQGVLVRTGTNFTAMVSIAEAAFVLLGKVYSDLIWALLEVAERELRADAANEQRQYSYLQKKREISSAEHIEKLRDSRERRSRWDERRLTSGKESEYSSMSKIAQQITEIKLEQKILTEKLDGIQEQNKQILHLLTGFFQRGNEADTTLPSTLKEARDKFGDPVPSRAESNLKYYDESFIAVYLRRKDEKWFVCVHGLKAELSFLTDWLEMALGGRGFRASSSLLSGCIRLEDDNQRIWREDTHLSKTPKEVYGCWRKRIVSGNILGSSPSMAADALGKAAGGISYGNQGFSHPFSQCEDGLILSAATLWSLFDNALERVPHCKCTFTAESGEFIQCKGKSGKWLLWHTFSDELPCDGQRCETNVCVALTTEEPGERIYTTSPCVLGWAAQSRTKLDSPLWATLRATEEFRNKEFATYKVKEFQALAQLSVPVIVSPQIGGAITFSKRNYKVANSIDPASILAMEIAAATVVLIFDERRGFHFSCDGADIIEMLCLQYLGDMGCNASYFPPFTHPTALLRLHTWYQSSFVSPTGTYITGDHLVREASRKVSQLVELTKIASKDDSTLLYWLLEDVLRSTVGKAIKAPRTQQVSWHRLAFKYPPLIFAVGEIDAKLITGNNFPLKWTKSNINAVPKTPFNLKGVFLSHLPPGGIVGSQVEIKRWLAQAQSFYRATLGQTNDRVVFGNMETDSEYTYKFVECSQENVVPNGIFASCQDCLRTGTQRCLHYIQ